MTNGNGNSESRLDRIERILEGVALRQDAISQQQQLLTQQLQQTRTIADSNARSIQAWEGLIEQNRVEAEEERSVLRVSINNMREGINQMQVGIDELRQASRENIAQHFSFMERFDHIQERLDRP